MNFLFGNYSKNINIKNNKFLYFYLIKRFHFYKLMIFYNCSSIYFAKYLMKLQIIRDSFGKTASENHLLFVISYLSIKN